MNSTCFFLATIAGFVMMVLLLNVMRAVGNMGKISFEIHIPRHITFWSPSSQHIFFINVITSESGTLKYIRSYNPVGNPSFFHLSFIPAVDLYKKSFFLALEYGPNFRKPKAQMADHCSCSPTFVHDHG